MGNRRTDLGKRRLDGPVASPRFPSPAGASSGLGCPCHRSSGSEARKLRAASGRGAGASARGSERECPRLVPPGRLSLRGHRSAFAGGRRRRLACPPCWPVSGRLGARATEDDMHRLFTAEGREHEDGWQSFEDKSPKMGQIRPWDAGHGRGPWGSSPFPVAAGERAGSVR